MSKRSYSSRSLRLLRAVIPISAALAIAGCDGSDSPAGTGTTTTSSSSQGGGGSGGAGGAGGTGGTGGEAFATYTNPLLASIPGGGVVESCPDPTVIRGQQPGDESWYVYCTSEPLNDEDRDPSGNYVEHLISILRSPDLITWSYAGDAFDALPSWAAPGSELWAPEIQFFNGKYQLYYTVVSTLAGGSAIGVATSDSPTGPWVHEDAPVVEPHPAPCCAGSQRWVYDPSIITDASGQRYIYYGSYFGGLSIRALSADGLLSDPASQLEVAIPNRYEAAYVIQRDGYYYLFASSSDCCNGPLTGYSVFAGRAESPMGPFVDREGVPLMAARVGGTPVVSMNGNRWVGPGHNTMLTDFAGQDWLLYHAIDAANPYFDPAPSGLPVKRPLMMDALDWVDGWPTVRGGQGPSDAPQPAPAARPGDEGHYVMQAAEGDVPGDAVGALSDEFDAGALGAQWSWVREPDASTFGLIGGGFRFQTQPADLHQDSNTASVLHEEAPAGDYLVETKVTLDLPPEGCCFNFVQAGLVIYGGDDSYIKLASFSNWDTRQIELAKEESPVPDGYPRYGGSVVGSTDKTIWLRIVKRAQGGVERYTGYSSRDGQRWVRGGTWTHALGAGARIGLVAMGRDPAAGAFPATFDYVRVFNLRQ